MAPDRIKSKPTSVEDPKFEKKRQDDKNAAIRAGTSKNTGRDLKTQKAVNKSAAADKGMPRKVSWTGKGVGGYYADLARKGVKKFLGKGPASRRKKKTNETLGSIAKP